MTRWRGGEGVTMRWCSGDLKLSPLLWTLQQSNKWEQLPAETRTLSYFWRLLIVGDRSLPGLTAARSINNGICDDDNIFWVYLICCGFNKMCFYSCFPTTFTSLLGLLSFLCSSVLVIMTWLHLVPLLSHSPPSLLSITWRWTRT